MTRTRTRTQTAASDRTRTAPAADPYRKSTAREYFESIVIAVILALFVRTWVVQAFTIPTGSMEHNLLVGDYLLVNKFVYGPTLSGAERLLLPQGEVSRGDIIVFKFPRDPERDFIKRVIGLPGETLEVRGGEVHIDGEPLDEPWLRQPGTASAAGAAMIPRRDKPRTGRNPGGHYFMMGDNRGNSEDSRVWGPMPEDHIKGRATILYWSYDFRQSGRAPRSPGSAPRCAESARWRRTSSRVRVGTGCCGRCADTALRRETPAVRQPAAGGVRRPKIAVPTRTIVAPSPIAISKSRVMPIDNSPRAAGSKPSSSRVSRSCRRRRNQGRTASGSSDHGGISISPRTRAARHVRAASSNGRTSSAGAPCLAASPARSAWMSRLGRGRRLGRGLIETAQQPCAVDGVNPVECDRGAAGLVGLQVADQVPPDPQPGCPLDLAQSLLDAVLSEVGQARARARFDGVQREGLRDGDQPDLVRVPGRLRWRRVRGVRGRVGRSRQGHPGLAAYSALSAPARRCETWRRPRARRFHPD